MTTELVVRGMNCANCVRHVTEALQGVAGVATASVVLDPGSASVRWSDPLQAQPEALLQVVKAAGYDVELARRDAPAAKSSEWSPLAGWRFNVVAGAAVTIPLMLGEWVFGLGMIRWYQWVAFALALPVQIVCGARFYQGAWRQLKAGASNMDTLVALGSTTAFVYSTWGLFAGVPGHLYFMEAAAIITLISAGHWLEALAGERAADSLRALLHLAPQTARRLESTGRETEVPVAQLVPGDRIELRPGDRVPTDGEVIEGGSTVDEAMLTGESLPVEKSKGASLYAGTINQDGKLVMEVRAVGQATALAQIIAAVQRAQSSRADIQRLADRASSIFVPIVVVIALLTAAWWGFAYASASQFAQSLAPWLWPVSIPPSPLAAAVVHAAAVLIVACPCAMGLATPAAIMAGTNAAAAKGILIRDGQALEKSGHITAVVFDKTGTLTQGRLAIVAKQAFGGVEIESLVKALAAPSNHPISRALAGPDSNPTAEPAQPFQDWRETRGCGVSASTTTGSLRLGALNWLLESGVDLKPGEPFAEEWSGKGATVIGLARDAQLLGLIALADTLKAGSASVVSQLKAQGKKVYLLTGDQKRTAAAIATEAGIAMDCVFAEVRPEAKAGILARLQSTGERVAFVGDGINDAPALEQADLGIAVAKASDVAREAADIILLRSDIEAVPQALRLAQATLRTIKQNLFWAFFYNAAAVPLAAVGFLSPILCAAAMGLSDVIVIGNALRLRHRV